ncbi:hypothetical protein 2 [Beihai picorna-like virus 58]|uniref:hypothetical protein 2 n=1 Tax=Beihai picorna-like virus 58 TaxID=1922603 RepID=UPI00090B786B|nr:hypothetical protein 2 [Beihai picorna-like virus 58]APG76707.1 hypothetical protein 2 [Beihai picorna-like virus 58]
MRCTLKLKVVVNATPFQYGMAWFVYKPLAGVSTIDQADLKFSSEGNDFSGGNMGDGSVYERFIQWSTRQKIEVYPQTNQGGEMTINFCYPGNWFEYSESTFNSLMPNQTYWGKIDVCSLSALRSAAADASTDCSIAMYAWCEDIELSGPSNFILQSGPVSGAMFKVSDAMETVGSAISYVRPYTSVVSGIAKVAGTVAQLFGHTPDYMTGKVTAGLIQSNPHLATCDEGLSTSHLQLSTRNSIPMDPTDTGFPMIDELDIKYVLSKPVFVTYSDWKSTQTPDDTQPLMVLNVSPEIYARSHRLGASSGSMGYSSVSQSLSSYVANMHEYWRGEITYHFRILCSQYHRGRIKITFDPEGKSTAEGYQITKVMDLNESSECTLTVPWLAPTYWLKCGHIAYDPSVNKSCVSSTMNTLLGGSSPWGPAGLANFNNDTMLGRITVQVLNPLRSPDASADAMVVVSADTSKLEFAYPQNNRSYDSLEDKRLTYSLTNLDNIYELQSGEADHYFGEKNHSLRSLAQRTCEYLCFHLTPNHDYMEMVLPVVPAGSGVMTGTLDLDNGNFAIPTRPLTKKGCINNLTFASLIYSCYVGQRGSYIWRCQKPPYGSNSFGPVSGFVSRTFHRILKTCRIGSLPSGVIYDLEGLGNGAAMANGAVESTIVARVQNYMRYKFVSCNPRTPYRLQVMSNLTKSNSDEAALIKLRLESPMRATGTTAVGLEKLTNRVQVSVGDDWTAFGLLNAPTVWLAHPGNGTIERQVTYEVV